MHPPYGIASPGIFILTIIIILIYQLLIPFVALKVPMLFATFIPKFIFYQLAEKGNMSSCKILNFRSRYLFVDFTSARAVVELILYFKVEFGTYNRNYTLTYLNSALDFTFPFRQF